MLNTLHSAPTRHQLRLRLSCRRVLVAPGPARLHQLLPSRIFDVSSFEDEVRERWRFLASHGVSRQPRGCALIPAHRLRLQPRASVVARSARSANPKKKSSRPRRPSGAPSAGTARPRTPRGAAVTEDGDEDDEESGLGWWENPAERDLQAFAPKPLKDWQNHKLELAYTQGRRKMPVRPGRAARLPERPREQKGSHALTHARVRASRWSVCLADPAAGGGAGRRPRGGAWLDKGVQRQARKVRALSGAAVAGRLPAARSGARELPFLPLPFPCTGLHPGEPQTLHIRPCSSACAADARCDSAP